MCSRIRKNAKSGGKKSLFPDESLASLEISQFFMKLEKGFST